MDINLAIKDYEERGCEQCSLGIATMPEGYALMLNGDRTHYFWISDRGEESVIHWNKWIVYRGAKEHADLRAKLRA